ncbi:MAG: hypothetical protein PHN44_00605 [Candidatus Marinimicrobia bacterium]|nr:hypothetical protein [Candidatus Neomarinimicrobiota bacterium]MDD5539134.1 hypothetical protein [Candidatus Neomarinimicrobiota bacterium]
MSTEPLKNYIRSIELLKEGKQEAAEKSLADSLGIKKLTPFMKANIKKLADAEDPHTAILTIINSKMQEE